MLFQAKIDGVFLNGKRLQLKGANWFGMETEAACVHALWKINWREAISFLVTNKFNLVRMPMSVDLALNLDTVKPTTIDYSLNPDLQDLSAGAVMDVVVKELARNGILVMPVFHKFTHNDPISELWYREPDFPESKVVSAWLAIVRRFKDVPHVFAIDIKNEPHGCATWRVGNPATDWADAAERIGNAILAENSKLLIVVEGLDNHFSPDTPSNPRYGAFWGGVLDDVKRNPVRLSVPRRLVYSPHVYGPDVFPMPYFSAPDFPANMPPIWNAQWSYIASEGIGCVLIGELGGKCSPGSTDEKWHQELASYISKRRRLRGSFIVWSFNANSGDTGGLVEDGDWRTPVQHKLKVYEKMCPKPSTIPPLSA